MPVRALILSDKCSQIIRSPGVPITDIEGRTIGNNVSFMQFTYSDYTMRRKAEVLKYRKGDTTSNKYAYLTKNSYYSRSALKKFIDNKTTDCNPTSCACSGIKGSDTLYYLDPTVPYYPSI